MENGTKGRLTRKEGRRGGRKEGRKELRFEESSSLSNEKDGSVNDLGKQILFRGRQRREWSDRWKQKGKERKKGKKEKEKRRKRRSS